MGYNREKVAERLGDLRSASGLSLAKLSKAIKEKTGVYISGTQLQKYENTEKITGGNVEKITDIMNVENAMAIADFYRVSYDYVLGYSDTRYRKHHNTAEETGLSEAAIIRLKKWNEFVFYKNSVGATVEAIENRKAPDEVSALIESRHLKKLIDYIRALSFLATGEKTDVKNNTLGPNRVDTLKALLGTNETYNYIMSLAANVFRDIVKEIVPFTPVEGERRDATQADIDDFYG